MPDYNWEGERLIPIEVGDVQFAYHITRYAFLKEKYDNKKILDAACGAGYGSYFMSTCGANDVTGVDISKDAVSFAKQYYEPKTDNLSFLERDITDLGFEDGTFDMVVSLETLEHVPDLDAYIGELKRVLKKGGTFFASVPDKKTNLDSGVENPFHMNELYLDDFKNFMLSNFNEVNFFIQYIDDVSIEAPQPSRIKSVLKKIAPEKIIDIYRNLKGTNSKNVFNGTNFDEFYETKPELINNYKVGPLDSYKYPSSVKTRKIYLAYGQNI